MVSARFANGQTSRTLDARLGTDAQNLVISIDAKQILARWPYNKMRVLDEGGADTPALFGCDDAPAARLFVHDPVLSRRIKTRLTGARRSPHALTLDWGMVFSLLVLCGVFALGAPMLFHRGSAVVARMIPLAWEAPLGQMVLTDVTQDAPRCTSRAAQAAAEKILARLAASNQIKSTPRLIIIQEKYANAFALPGNMIVVNSGLLQLVEQEGELAGVLGHEMGHLVNRHPLDGIFQALGLQVAFSAMAAGNGEALTQMAAMGASFQSLGYSRDHERVADRASVVFLRHAGYDPAALGRLLSRMMAKEHEADRRALEEQAGATNKPVKMAKEENEPEFMQLFSDHPALPERLAIVGKSTAYDKGGGVLSPAEMKALRNDCAAEESLK